MKLKDLITEKIADSSQADEVYEHLLKYFERSKEDGPRFQSAYEIWDEYKNYITVEIYKALLSLTEEKAGGVDVSNIDKVIITYTTHNDFNGVWISRKDSGKDFLGDKKHEKLWLGEFQELLQDLGIKGDIDYKYNPEKLEEIIKQLEEKGIEASFNNDFDVD